jgi:hypothetical protein
LSPLALLLRARAADASVGVRGVLTTPTDDDDVPSATPFARTPSATSTSLSVNARASTDSAT